VDEILADAGVDIDDLTAEKVSERFADIEQIDRLATIAEIRRLARRIAEAQIELRRVRHARHARRQFLSDNLNNMYNDAQPNMRDKEAVIGKFLRSSASQIPWAAVVENVMTPMPPRLQKSALGNSTRHAARIR
jgi:hypothetical protein